MSWRTIARRDALQPYRTRSLFVYLSVFVLLFAFATHAQTGFGRPLASFHVGTGAFIVPIVGLFVGHKAVAGPRENGGLRVVLSFPHTRREVVFGAAVGRSVLVASLVTVGFLASLVVYLAQVGVPDLALLAVAWGLSVLLGVATTVLAVGISASVRTTTRAVAAVFGAFLLLFLLWGQLSTFIRFALNGFAMPSGPPPEWAAVFAQLNPGTAYRTAMAAVVGTRPVDASYYTAPWFSVAVMLSWLSASLLTGLWRFDRGDL